MTFYQREIDRIRKKCYANEQQVATVIGVRRFINNNFEQDLNLDFLSRIRFTSKFHLLRLFKKYYGQTLNDYLTDIRIQKAKLYLKQGKTVSETCYAIGFESPSSFSTLFRRKMGLPPSVFQKKQYSQCEA